MEYTKTKTIINEVKNLVTDHRTVIFSMMDGEDSFECENYRFIHTDKIDEIMQDELLSDRYMLGCFSHWFIAEITELPLKVVSKAQANESYEVLGELMALKIEEVQSKYASADGYGHHFAHYDGYEHEIGEYLAFRVS